MARMNKRDYDVGIGERREAKAGTDKARYVPTLSVLFETDKTKQRNANLAQTNLKTRDRHKSMHQETGRQKVLDLKDRPG